MPQTYSVCCEKMSAFVVFSFLVFAHCSLGSDHLDKLLKTHPTWSFEEMSVDALIKEARAFDSKLTEDTLKAKITAKFGPETTHIVRKVGDPKWSKNPPASFDAREEWKQCADLFNEVENEGACFTDGPVVAASIATDRYCIYTNGTSKQRFSAEMLAGCAEACASKPYAPYSFDYIAEHGIPTGGSYKTNEGCLPYSAQPCKHSNASYVPDGKDETLASEIRHGKLKPCEDIMTYDRDCPTECSNPKYPRSLDEDRKKFTAWYTLSFFDFHIRNEILAYGPMATSIELFDDFFQYPKNGMYKHTWNSFYITSDKYIKLIGWGTESETKYWLAVNTWDDWGPTKVFKIPRDVNYVGVEWFMLAGVYDPL